MAQQLLPSWCDSTLQGWQRCLHGQQEPLPLHLPHVLEPSSGASLLMMHRYLWEDQKQHCCLSCSDLLPPPMKHMSSCLVQADAKQSRLTCLSECKKRQGSGSTATPPAARHYLSAKSSASTVDLLLTGEFHSGSDRKESFPGTREAAAHPDNTLPKGFRAFPCYFCTNRATALSAGAATGCPGSGSPAARRLRHPTRWSC